MIAILIFVAVFAGFPRAVGMEPERPGASGTDGQAAGDASASAGNTPEPGQARDGQKSTETKLVQIDLSADGTPDPDENRGYGIIVGNSALLQLRVSWQVMPPYPPDDYVVSFQVESAGMYRLWMNANQTSEIVPVIQGEWPPCGTQLGLRDLPTSVWLETVEPGSGSITATITRIAPAP